MKRPVYIVVTPFFPSPTRWDGSYCLDFVKALMTNGRYDVRVFVPGDDGCYDYAGVHVTTFKTRSMPSMVFPFIFKRFNVRSFHAALIRDGIDMNEIAVCHAHTALFAIYPLSVKNRNPACLTLLHHHDLESFGLNMGCLKYFWLYNVIQYTLLRRLHEKLDCHIFISEASRRSFMKVPDASWTNYPGYRKQMRGLSFFKRVRIKRSLILHNGVNIDLFHGNGARESGNTIGCIANFIDWKDQITLLKAMCVIRDMGNLIPRVRFIGTGPMLSMCMKFAADNKLDDYVSFEKEMEHSRLPDCFYNSIDLFVLPSYFEGFGCVFTESYACGVPFITCEGQGMDEFIPENERQLWLCKPKNAEDLARKIVYFFHNRPVQHLKGEIAIQPLVDGFVKQLEVIRSEHEAIDDKRG